MFHIRSDAADGPEPPLEHGGDLARAGRLFPDAPRPWIDLSTGVNPHAYPFAPPPPESFARLPDEGARAALEQAAADAYGLASAREIVAAPGAQALIQILPRLLRGRRVGVLGPTYAEHAESWRRAGREVVDCRDLDELARCDIGVVVNPNNPDGRIVAPDALAALARRMRLVVDESFVDFTPDLSLAPSAAAQGAIALRSFGKAYGLAGLRLGFAVGARDFVAASRRELGPWAVSGPALAIGAQALGDARWSAEMRARLTRDAARLDALLVKAGFDLVGGTCLFRLAAHPRAGAVADALGRKGVLVRRFAAQPDWLRFGIPAWDAWPRVEAALREAGDAP